MTAKVKKNLLIFGASSVGVLMVATLTVGVIYKMNKTAEYEALLTQQQIQMQQEAQASEAAEAAASSSKLEIPPIKSLEEQKQDSKIAAKNAGLAESSSSAPEISVSTDEGGNQTITEEYSKPEPTEEELHNPSSAPETPSSSKQTDNPGGVQYDENGNQIPNEKGEIYLPGFGWVKSTGGKSKSFDNTGWEDSQQVGF